MFWSDLRQKGIPLYPSVLLYKNGVYGVKHSTNMFLMLSLSLLSWLFQVRISAVSVYGDIWLTTEFNATTAGPLLENWALGGANILNSTSNDTPSLHGTVFK